MSKVIKDMLVDDLKRRLDGVGDVIVVSLGTLDAQKTTALRQALRKKRIELQLVKNSLARRAMADTPLAPAMEDAAGMLAIAWGGEDVVDLAKELDRLQGVKDFEGFECRGGPLSGQISSLGSVLSGQIISAGGALAGQLASRVDDLEKAGGGEALAG
jgi:large subunit ribosomal protein L10